MASTLARSASLVRDPPEPLDDPERLDDRVLRAVRERWDGGGGDGTVDTRVPVAAAEFWV